MRIKPQVSYVLARATTFYADYDIAPIAGTSPTCRGDRTRVCQGVFVCLAWGEPKAGKQGLMTTTIGGRAFYGWVDPSDLCHKALAEDFGLQAHFQTAMCA